MSALVIAAPSSGQGKTLFTFGLLRALKNKGVDVCPFKTGPDYIDAKFHEHASGRVCHNLDPWAMSDVRLNHIIQKNAVPKTEGLKIEGLKVIEGVMGLFDGAHVEGSNLSHSTAGLAIRLGVPVVLLVDCRRMAQSVAALVHGFQTFNSDLNLAGVVLNRVASAKHEAMLTSGLDVPVFGCLPQVDDLELASRHLGLVQAAETDALEDKCERAAGWISDHVDLDLLIQSADLKNPDWDQHSNLIPALGKHTAVARDAAFAFSYPHMLDDWKAAGTQLSFFSPLDDEPVDPAADSVFLPGGYPELYASNLAINSVFLASLHAAENRGAWIYGECGGFMVLGNAIIDADGKAHSMAGLLDVTTSFAKPKRQLGYRQVKFNRPTPFGPAGSSFRGHEFHFSALVEPSDANLFEVTDAMGNSIAEAGQLKGRVFGSYLHYIDSNMDIS